MSDFVRMNIRVPMAVRERLESRSQALGIPMSNYIVQLVAEGLERKEIELIVQKKLLEDAKEIMQDFTNK
jgi:predicted DNA-binding protein